MKQTISIYQNSTTKKEKRKMEVIVREELLEMDPDLSEDELEDLTSEWIEDNKLFQLRD